MRQTICISRFYPQAADFLQEGEDKILIKIRQTVSTRAPSLVFSAENRFAAFQGVTGLKQDFFVNCRFIQKIVRKFYKKPKNLLTYQIIFDILLERLSKRMG